MCRETECQNLTFCFIRNLLLLTISYIIEITANVEEKIKVLQENMSGDIAGIEVCLTENLKRFNQIEEKTAQVQKCNSADLGGLCQ